MRSAKSSCSETSMKYSNQNNKNMFVAKKIYYLLHTSVKMNPSGGRGVQAYDRGLSDLTGSNNSNSFWQHSDITNCRNLDLLGWDYDSES